MTNLNYLINQPGTTLGDAKGINDLGQIAATGYSDQYGYGAFLLTPVPEPASVIPLLSGSRVFFCVVPGAFAFLAKQTI